jgi:hypothetical protein
MLNAVYECLTKSVDLLHLWTLGAPAVSRPFRMITLRAPGTRAAHAANHRIGCGGSEWVLAGRNLIQ